MGHTPRGLTHTQRIYMTISMYLFMYIGSRYSDSVIRFPVNNSRVISNAYRRYFWFQTNDNKANYTYSIYTVAVQKTFSVI